MAESKHDLFKKTFRETVTEVICSYALSDIGNWNLETEEGNFFLTNIIHPEDIRMELEVRHEIYCEVNELFEEILKIMAIYQSEHSEDNIIIEVIDSKLAGHEKKLIKIKTQI